MMDGLIKLSQLIDPPPTTVDGKTYVFNNPNAAEVLTRVSAIVREMLDGQAAAPSAIPDHIGDASEMVAAPSVEPVGFIHPSQLQFLREDYPGSIYSAKYKNVHPVPLYTAEALAAAVEKAVAAAKERIAREWDGHIYADIDRIDIGAAIRGKG